MKNKKTNLKSFDIVHQKRNQAGYQTYLLIIDTFIDLLQELGPSAVSISAIADKSGIKRGSIYSIFGDLNSVYINALIYDFQKYEGKLIEEQSCGNRSEKTAIRKLLQLANQRRNPPLYISLQPYSKILGKCQNEILFAAIDEIHEYIVSNVRNAQRLGMIENKRNPNKVSNRILYEYQSLSLSTNLRVTPSNHREHIEEILDYIFSG